VRTARALFFSGENRTFLLGVSGSCLQVPLDLVTRNERTSWDGIRAFENTLLHQPPNRHIRDAENSPGLLQREGQAWQRGQEQQGLFECDLWVILDDRFRGLDALADVGL